MVTQGANVRRGVLLFSSLFLTIQLVSLVASLVFYLYASSGPYRDSLARAVIGTLYQDRATRNWLRRTNALEFHILISLALQLLFFVPNILLIIGASRRVRFLLLPWLIVFGLFQLCLMLLILLGVLYLPGELKLLSMAIVALEAFVFFPWWFAVIHLFAVFTNEEDTSLAIAEQERLSRGRRLRRSMGDVVAADTPNSFYRSYSLGRSSLLTKMSDI